MITKSKFGKVANLEVSLFTLSNARGTEISITNYGGIITSCKVSDINKKLVDVVLGFDDVAGYLSPEYLNNNPNFGGIIGRYANRIKHGKITIDNTDYQLSVNNGDNALHGGFKGFISKVWNAEIVDTESGATLALRYTSEDGEEGFPGKLETLVTYSLNDDNELEIEYTAATNKKTIVNFTNHSYFNLNGEDSGQVFEHSVQINAKEYTPADEESIPTGDIVPLNGTPLDFQTAERFGTRFDQVEGKGYDHNYVLDNLNKELKHTAKVIGDKSKIVMDLYTTEPGVQLYTANYLDGTLKGKGGSYYQAQAGFCLEPQVYPNSPNVSSFPNSILAPGEKYFQKSVYKFSTEA